MSGITLSWPTPKNQSALDRLGMIMVCTYTCIGTEIIASKIHL